MISPELNVDQEEFWASSSIETVASLLNAIGIAVFIIQVKGGQEFTVEFVNSYYESTFGVRNADLAGRTIGDLLTEPEAAKVVANYLRCVASGRVEAYDEEIALPTGLFFARTMLTPLRIGGSVVRLIGTTVDLTRRRALELELATARDRAEAANDAKTSFLANMSHELRTPLNAVIGYAELLKSEVLGPLGNEKYSSYAGNIMFAGQHLLEVVSDILDLARLEGGRIDLDEKITELPELLDDVLRLSKTVNDSTGPTLELGRIVETVRVNIDPRLTRQALVNLVSNAQKFTRPGGTIRLGTEILDDGRLCFVVSDTGRGIAAKDLPTALAPFGRVDPVASANTQGAGLGLPITKALVECHGGSLFVNSEPGVGTTVFVVLPTDRVIVPTGFRASPSVEGLKEFFTIDDVDISTSALSMDDESLDGLPVGAILLDREGHVLKYNATESSFSEMRAERIVGRNFFREVVPCTFSDRFQGRFRDVSEGKSPSELFSYVFTVRRAWKVLIEMRGGKDAGTVWLFIRWV